MQQSGLKVTGPYPADTLFHEEARKSYDAVIGMYHDQVLIPLKTLDFFGGVNITLGLDFIRTSPDHGTGLDIAGSGTARPDSLMAAINMARKMAAASLAGFIMNDPADGDLTASIDALPPLRLLVESMDMRARKSLGQNFLFDLNLTRKIARSAGPLTGTTIEIGPGPGGLTRALLLEHAAHVIAIEKDRRASAVLSSLSVAAGDRLTLIEADALTSPIWELGTAPRRIIANLPYNIATTLLIQWLAHANCFDSMTLMFQREVAERIIARPGDCGLWTSKRANQWLADAKSYSMFRIMRLCRRQKSPHQLSKLCPGTAPVTLVRNMLEFITRTAFGQRRKMLRSSLKKSMVTNYWQKLASPEKRPQDIDVEGFCKLANLYETGYRPNSQRAIA